MDADLFLQQFGHLAQSEGGIKKLRDVILQLAVRGKLVEQNPADEPARVLKERILKSKKTAKKQPIITPPYDAPSSWEWLCLSQTGQNWGQKTPDSEFTYIDVAAVDNLVGKVSQNPPIVQAADAPSRARKIVKKGTVIYSTVRPYLRNIAVVEQDYSPEAIASTAFAIIHPHDEINAYFLFYYLRSPDFVTYVESEMIGVAYPAINDAKFFSGAFPLPPLTEQKRIVAKVDELMALCDKLEAEQKTQRTLKTQAVQSTLHHLTSAESPTSFGTSLSILERTFGNWFDDLATVKHLRATILQLAVQGKLVPQNPTDEPAEKLVSRVNKKKHQLKPTETPFLLPHGWTWASFPQLGEFGRGKSKHRPRNDPRLYSGGKHPFVQTGDVSRARDYIRTYSATYNDEGLAQSKMWPAGTMCITIAANIAETAILAFDACFPDSVVGFIPHKEIGDARYFEYFLRTAKTRLEDFAPATAQKNINLGILEQVAIPLPPNAELKRIVAKVDELMALCDQLEAHITHTQTTGTHLMDSLIHRMTEAA